MKISSYINTLLVACLTTLSLTVNAATLSLINPVSYPTGGSPGNTGTISTVVNITDYMPGASQGYYIADAIPNAVDGSQLQTAFNAAGVGFTVTDFTKIEPPPAGNMFDSSSLGLAFEGFLMKVGNFTLVGLFDTPITSLFYNNDGLGGISHVAYFNTSPVSAVPIPAALWLFAPALLGFLSFRRRLVK
ncbi:MULTISPECIES: hypothetical protein [unclassified Methylophaga]|uniref:hypothetical protein n=1 Tax=unclassified Methylophaga TaxID=2629249 RepID=UPI000C996D22|nr:MULTISPECIES: hypothetical protein [unclassified Methylophaga]MBN45920.1 hypothetical protein [Methylophaga sp.]|tara:strand:- start:110349 stop:110915 length:567 start_codon:yes stop_codon:yes gene_type:complete